MFQQTYDKKLGFYTTTNQTNPSESKESEDALHPAKRHKSAPIENPNANTSKVKISCLISPIPSDDELTFLEQLGVTHTFTWISNEQSTYEFLIELRKKVEAHNLVLWNVGNRALGKSPNTILALADRDKDIEAFIQFIRNLAKAGIHITTFTWEPDGVWNTHEEITRGGATCRAMDAEVLAKQSLTRGRVYSEDELWRNFEYLMSKVLPVCQEVGVKLALHPNDPPVPQIGGIPCLIRNKAAYERAFKIANSSFLGMEFCCGCWLEGGTQFGNIFEALPEFIKEKKVLIVHLRNVTSPLPRFAETFIDGGYGDMYKIMKTLKDNDYDGTVILDHTPQFIESAGPSSATAFAIGYMKALLNAACHH